MIFLLACTKKRLWGHAAGPIFWHSSVRDSVCSLARVHASDEECALQDLGREGFFGRFEEEAVAAAKAATPLGGYVLSKHVFRQ